MNLDYTNQSGKSFIEQNTILYTLPWENCTADECNIAELPEGSVSSSNLKGEGKMREIYTYTDMYVCVCTTFLFLLLLMKVIE
jgi:hypothetical protein